MEEGEETEGEGTGSSSEGGGEEEEEEEEKEGLEFLVSGKHLAEVRYNIYIQVAELASLAQLLPPCSPTVCNPAPDSSLKSCFSPIASASAAARRLCPLQLLLAARSRPLRLLLPDCVRLNCCSPDCVRFDCCSPIAYPGPMFSNILRGVRGSVNKLKYKGRASL